MRWPWSGRRSATRCATAGGTAVTVTVDATHDLQIDVVDDGIGIDPSAARSGLRNLEERARECAGELTVRRRAARRHAAELAGAAPVIPAVMPRGSWLPERCSSVAYTAASVRRAKPSLCSSDDT